MSRRPLVGVTAPEDLNRKIGKGGKKGLAPPIFPAFLFRWTGPEAANDSWSLVGCGSWLPGFRLQTDLAGNPEAMNHRDTPLLAWPRPEEPRSRKPGNGVTPPLFPAFCSKVPPNARGRPATETYFNFEKSTGAR